MQILDRTGVGTLWSICKTKFALAGHTHNYAGSGSAGGSANSAIGVVDYGRTSKKIQIGYDGPGITGEQIKYIAGYTTGSGDVSAKIKDVSKDALRSWLGLGTLAYSSATITDNKVTQNAVKSSDYTNWRSLVFSAANSATEGFVPSTTTDGVFIANTLSVQPSSGTIKANKFKGALEGNASTASSASTVNGYTVNANVPSNAKFTDTEYVIPTLSSAPTSSTLTFTDNGVTRSFKVGYMCRVADSSAEDGYKFYRLYDISDNNAVWGEISGGSVEINEVVSVSLISNQSNSDTSLNGATIIVTNTDTGNVISTHQWEGTELKLKVAPVTPVSISVSSVNGYRSPDAKAFTTGVGSTRNVTMQYDTEVVTITLTANNGADMSGQVVTVNNEKHTYSSPLSVKIPFGTNYSISVNKNSEYIAPKAVKYTANQKIRSVTLSYTYAPMGVYIYDTDGNFITANKWNTANNRKAVGVYVGTENTKLIISPTYPTSGGGEEWGNNTIISGIVTTEKVNIARKDYAGEANTNKIISQLGEYRDTVAKYCRNYTFKNGKKGYLWSLGEAYDVFNNIDAVEAALQKIGGEIIELVEHWTSTQYSSYYAWVQGEYGYSGYKGKDETGQFSRPVCSL